jgi:hypothetical protein
LIRKQLPDDIQADGRHHERSCFEAIHRILGGMERDGQKVLRLGNAGLARADVKE